jgi:hypothetical protein
MNLNVKGEELSGSSTVCKQKHMVLIHANMFKNMQNTCLRNVSIVDEYVVTVAREIMPDCVLSVVRGLYPNPPSQPYMGHKWL